jgi:YVTN family beta-propeller protein
MRCLRLCLLTFVIGNTGALAQAARVSGTLVVTNKTPSTATILDVASGRVLATLPTGNGPHEVVITRDGSIAVVTDYGSQAPGSSLTVIDVPGKRIARTITLGEYRRPHGIAFLPGDTLVAVTSETNRAVLLVNVHSGAIVRVVQTAQTGSHMVAVTGDGRRAWTGNIGSNTVSELDLTTGVALRTIAVPAAPEAINVTPDGKEVWVGSNATGVVSVVDAATGAVTPTATGLGWPYRVLYSPDTALVLLPDLRGETLRFVERKTHNELARLSLVGKAPQGITFAPNGRTAFLSFSGTGRIAVIDVATRAVTREIDAGQTPDGVAYTTRTVQP